MAGGGVEPGERVEGEHVHLGVPGAAGSLQDVPELAASCHGVRVHAEGGEQVVDQPSTVTAADVMEGSSGAVRAVRGGGCVACGAHGLGQTCLGECLGTGVTTASADVDSLLDGVPAGRNVSARLLGETEIEKVMCLRRFEAQGLGGAGGTREVPDGIGVPLLGVGELAPQTLAKCESPKVTPRTQELHGLVGCRPARLQVSLGDGGPRREQPAGTFLPALAEPVQLGAASSEDFECVGGATVLGVDERQVEAGDRACSGVADADGCLQVVGRPLEVSRSGLEPAAQGQRRCPVRVAG